MCGRNLGLAQPLGSLMALHAYLYDAEGHDREVVFAADLLQSLSAQQLLWLDAKDCDASELRELGQQLSLDEASLSIIGGPAQSRVENHGSYVQFFVDTAPATLVRDDTGDLSHSGKDHGSARLDFVVGSNWLLTVHDGTLSFIENFRSQDRPETMIGALTSHDFAASLLDAHLEAFFDEIARIEGMVDRLDEQALTQPTSKSLLGRLVTLRRRVSRLRRLLARQRGIFYGLSRPDLQVVTENGTAAHFQVLIGRFERAIDEVEHTRDLVVGSFELFATRTGQQTNDLVKVLTYLTAVIGICAAVAGVFGMNFETGFFSVGDAGFYATIAGLALVVVIATFLAKWRGWI